MKTASSVNQAPIVARAVRDGGTYGPSSWDGYAAAVVSDAALESMNNAARAAVRMDERPTLYSSFEPAEATPR